MSVVRYLYIVSPLALPGAGFGLEPGEAGLFGIAEEVLVRLVEVSGHLLQCQGVGLSEPGGASVLFRSGICVIEKLIECVLLFWAYSSLRKVRTLL